MPLPSEQYEKFESLFREHYNSLAAYAFTILKNRADAEDVVQDVFVRIWQKNPSVIGNEGIKFYLFTATKNNCISLLRRQAALVPFTEQEGGLAELPSGDPPAGKPVDYAALIQQAFELLPPQCRTIFRMSRLARLTYAEIAAELNLSVKTVENQMGKAIRLMREYARKNKIPLPVLYFFLAQCLSRAAGIA